METRVSSAVKEVVISDKLPTVLIGERINPTGRKKMAEALIAGNLEIVCKEVLEQVQAGADILDVNVGAAGVDEVSMLPQAVQAVMNTVGDVPLCLDSTNLKALEAALEVYKGKPLINSVTGEEHSMATILPLTKRHGAAVIGLLQDEQGIPNNVEQRVAIAHKIVNRAAALGISSENIIIDCLAMAVSTNTMAGLLTLETCRKVKNELGVNMTIGASNVSFGLPERHLVSNVFLSLFISAGVTCPIADVAKARPTVLATDLALGRDRFALRYIKAHRQRQMNKNLDNGA